MKPRQDFSKEFDILSIMWGTCEHSRELKNVDIVIDFDKKDNIVGIELFDFGKALKESQKEIDRIFELPKKRGWGRSYGYDKVKKGIKDLRKLK